MGPDLYDLKQMHGRSGAPLLNDQFSNPAGLIETGNIDLTKRPVVHNPDGSMSTVRSAGVNMDGREVLIPTVSDDGRIMDIHEAVDAFRKSGKHLGMFDTPEHSNSYAQRLHEQQERMYRGR